MPTELGILDTLVNGELNIFPCPILGDATSSWALSFA